MIEFCPTCDIRQNLPAGTSEQLAQGRGKGLATRCLEMCVLNEDPGFVGINCRDGDLETTVEVTASGELTGAAVTYDQGEIDKRILPDGAVSIL